MAAVGKRKFPTFFICWSDSRNHSWALAWLGVGGKEGAPTRAEPRDAERPGGPTEAVALDTPKASPFLPGAPLFLGHFELVYWHYCLCNRVPPTHGHVWLSALSFPTNEMGGL